MKDDVRSLSHRKWRCKYHMLQLNDVQSCSSWPNENFIGAVKNIVAILADLPNTTLTVWKTAKAPKTESAKVQPLMLRIRKFSIR